MDMRVTDAAVKDAACDALIVGAGRKKGKPPTKEVILSQTAKRVDDLLNGLISEICVDGEFQGNFGELITIHTMGKMAAKRVAVIGLGNADTLNGQSIRRASAIGARQLQSTGMHSMALALNWEDALVTAEEGVQAEVAGMDFIDVKRPYAEKGATGLAVRTLAELAMQMADN